MQFRNSSDPGVGFYLRSICTSPYTLWIYPTVKHRHFFDNYEMYLKHGQRNRGSSLLPASKSMFPLCLDVLQWRRLTAMQTEDVLAAQTDLATPVLQTKFTAKQVERDETETTGHKSVFSKSVKWRQVPSSTGIIKYINISRQGIFHFHPSRFNMQRVYVFLKHLTRHKNPRNGKGTRPSVALRWSFHLQTERYSFSLHRPTFPPSLKPSSKQKKDKRTHPRHHCKAEIFLFFHVFFF